MDLHKPSPANEHYFENSTIANTNRIEPTAGVVNTFYATTLNKLNQVEEQVQVYSDKTLTYIYNKPVLSALIAASLGFVLSSIYSLIKQGGRR